MNLEVEKTLGVVNLIFYIVHIIVASVIIYRQKKKEGTKTALLILVFLLVIFFVSLQVGGFLAQFLFIGKELTSKMKSIHDTLVIAIATIVELPIWVIFLKKEKQKTHENKDNSTDSPR